MANAGRTVPVLFEHSVTKGYSTGFTPNYIKVLVPEKKGLKGTIMKVKLSHPSEEGIMFGDLV